jgi:hypothetical protein
VLIAHRSLPLAVLTQLSELETEPYVEVHLARSRRAAWQPEERCAQRAAVLAEIDMVEKVRHADGKGYVVTGAFRATEPSRPARAAHQDSTPATAATAAPNSSATAATAAPNSSVAAATTTPATATTTAAAAAATTTTTTATTAAATAGGAAATAANFLSVLINNLNLLTITFTFAETECLAQ